MLNRIMLRAAIGVFGRWARYRVVQKTLLPIRFREKLRWNPIKDEPLDRDVIFADANKVLVPPTECDYKSNRMVPVFVRGPLTPNAATEPVNMAARIVHAAWKRVAHDPRARPREFPSVLPDCDTTPIVRGTPPARAKASPEKLKEWRRDFYDHPTTRRDGG